MRNFLKHNLIAILLSMSILSVIAAATTYNRPYSSTVYNAGTKAVGTYVNGEFQSIADWLNGGNISATNLAALAVTQSKLFTNMVITNASSLFTSTGNTATQVTNLTASITTQGRPVHLYLQGTGTTYLISGTSTLASFLYSDDNNLNASYLTFNRDSSTLSQQKINYHDSLLYADPCSSYSHTDFVSAGTYTYTVKVFSNPGKTATVAGCRLVVREL
jgi:hypothetical protein